MSFRSFLQFFHTVLNETTYCVFHSTLLSLTMAGLVLHSGIIFAQQTAPVIPPQLDISRQRVPATLPKTPEYDLRIQAPEKSAIPKAVDEIQFDIKRIDIEGATYFQASYVNQYFNALIGQKAGLQSLREAAEKLEYDYRERGFFLTRVFIPPQQVKDGVFKVKVVEGYVANVVVDGGSQEMNQLVSILAQTITKKRPVDLASLERTLLLINDLPGVVGAGVLKQGEGLGASELLVTVSQAPTMQMVSLGNTGSNITGPWSTIYSGIFNRPFNKDGAFSASLTGTGGDLREVRSYLGRYLTPVGSYGVLFSVGALFANAVPGGLIRALGIESKLQSFTPRLRYPLLRSRANSVYLDSGFSVNRSKTTIQGETLTEDKTTVGELTFSWVQNGWLNGYGNYAFSVFKSLKWFGAMGPSATNPSVQGFDPTFTRYALNLNRLQPLHARWSLQVVANAQYTNDKLLSGELLSFGGPTIGRGYDPSAIIGDRGVGALLELRYDSVFAFDPWFGNAQLYGFVDDAKVTSIASSTNDTTRASLGSAGVGARFPVLKNHLLDVQLARSRFQAMTADARYDPRLLVSATIRF